VGRERAAGPRALRRRALAARAGRGVAGTREAALPQDAIAAKLGADPALGKLDDEVSRGLEPSERTLRRVQDAVEEAAEQDRAFGTAIEALLARLEEQRGSAPVPRRKLGLAL
jgi:hypothetical protein